MPVIGAIGRGFEVIIHADILTKDLATVAAFEERVSAMDEIAELRRMFGLPDYFIRVQTADLESYEVWLTTRLLGDPAIARVDSRLTMKLVKDRIDDERAACSGRPSGRGGPPARPPTDPARSGLGRDQDALADGGRVRGDLHQRRRDVAERQGRQARHSRHLVERDCLPLGLGRGVLEVDGEDDGPVESRVRESFSAAALSSKEPRSQDFNRWPLAMRSISWLWRASSEGVCPCSSCRPELPCGNCATRRRSLGRRRVCHAAPLGGARRG